EVVGRAQLPGKLDSLAVMTSANSAHANRVRVLSEKLRRWESEFAEPALRGDVADESMMAGKPLFDEVRAAFDAFIATSESDLRAAEAGVRNTQLLGAALILAELLAALGILLFVVRGRLLKQARELAHQQELLEQQAVELEMQVADMEAGNQALAEREEKLRKSEERYRYVSLATNDAVYEWDIGTNRFEWNDGMSTLFGYSAEEVEDSPNWITSLVHDEDVHEITNTFAAAFTDGASQWTHDYRLRRRDGKYANVQGRAYILRDDSGNPTRVIGAITDRTQQQSLESQLRQAQKMEAIGRLAGGIAHDFNNILTVIRMSSEFLLAEIPESDEKHQDAQEIMKAADRASRLTRQLLAFSRHQVLNPTQLSLNDIVAGMEGMIRRVVPENIEMTTELEPALFLIKADAGQMEQVLLNLVINAADAMPNGGRLAIRTTNSTVDASFSATHLDVPAGEYVCVNVSDTGFGMDQQTLARIFDPFFTTKAVGKGTGLGLATVHGIVTQSGGKIWVYSEPGMGTTFKIYLPRTDAVSTVTAIPILTEETEPPTETILLVEDEDPTREAVHRTLTRAGYKVIEARNGLEAFEAAKTHRGVIDVVLTDSMMPEMGGAELAGNLRRARPDIRIVMMSGYTEDVAGVDSGLEDVFFIEKPFTRADLMLVLRSALKA
ncbi:MAG TPA: ATP-binding protein, partial [Gemmatimonadaceae bacterium]|nr:ATP-binding protein [Gemmatimonadaceae bacterium]